MTKRKQPEDLKIGFWLNINKAGPTVRPKLGPCWLWMGAKTAGGYGLVHYLGKTRLAHRAAWIKAHGDIEDGLLVCHHCDNPPCVKAEADETGPAHLFLGTPADNMRDMYAKGRGPIGDKNGSRTRPDRRAWGNRNGTRTRPETRARGDDHYTRRTPGLFAGERNGRCKLTDRQVAEIRDAYAVGDISQASLAARFGVVQVTISKIVRGASRRQQV